MDVGKHCSCLDCKLKDFLPFTCLACKLVYCLDHRSLKAHSCKRAIDIELILPQCPKCNVYIPYDEGIDLNEKLAAHISSNCSLFGKKSLDKQQCHFESCSMNLITIECQHCRNNYCLEHRFPTSHNCSVYKDPAKDISLTKAKEKEMKKSTNTTDDSFQIKISGRWKGDISIENINVNISSVVREIVSASGLPFETIKLIVKGTEINLNENKTLKELKFDSSTRIMIMKNVQAKESKGIDAAKMEEEEKIEKEIIQKKEMTKEEKKEAKEFLARKILCCKNAKGDGRIKEDNRAHIQVNLNEKPIYIYLNKNWNTAAILDALFEYGGVDKSLKLNLFNEKDEKLEKIQSLRDIDIKDGSLFICKLE